MPHLLDQPAEADAPCIATPDAPSVTLPVPRGGAPKMGLRKRAVMGVASLCCDWLGQRVPRAFGILMYHRVAVPPPERPAPTWNVPPELLERQLAGLIARGWRALPLRHVLECVERDLPIPRKTFVVTFDDGYANNFTQALPILTRLHVPATVFVATAYLDSNRPFPSDNWLAAGQPGVPSESWRPLTSDECQRLTANGLVELGAHTHTHADFRGRPEAFIADLDQNLAVLRERFGVEQPAFAFPYGTKHDGFANPALASAARQAGAACCLTTEAAIVRPGDSPLDWGRFAAEDHDTARTLAFKLAGWYEAFRMLGRRLQGKRF